MDVGGEIKLAVGSDFIAPALACTKPKQIEAADQSKATPGPTKHVLRIEGSDESMKPTSASVARITLNDCLACSGCVTSAETMLISQQSAEEFLRGSAHATLTLISISPAARAAIAADTGLSVRDAFSRLTSFFKGLGCDRVLDCGLASDLSLLQNAAEFVQRFKLKQPATEERLQPPPVLESVLESASVGPLPLVSSSCPGWVCYAEKTHPNSIPHISTAKSAQQVLGTALKRVICAHANTIPSSVFHGILARGRVPAVARPRSCCCTWTWSGHVTAHSTAKVAVKVEESVAETMYLLLQKLAPATLVRLFSALLLEQQLRGRRVAVLSNPTGVFQDTLEHIVDDPQFLLSRAARLLGFRALRVHSTKVSARAQAWPTSPALTGVQHLPPCQTRLGPASTWTRRDPSARCPANVYRTDALTEASSSGAATFAGLSIQVAGTYVLRIDSASPSYASNTVTFIVSHAASRVAWRAQTRARGCRD